MRYFRGRSAWLPYLSMAPLLFFFVFFAIIPSVTTIFWSLTNISGVPGSTWQFIGLQNYKEFFSPGSLPQNVQALWRTFIWVGAISFIQNAIAILLAVLLNRRPFGHLFFRTVIFLPVILGVTVIGLMWTLILDPTDGPVATFLQHYHIFSALLGDERLAFPLVISIQIWSTVGYAMIIYLAGLQSIPAELSEAAIVDGAGPVQLFTRVTFPLLAPSVTTNILLSIIGSFQSYQIIYVLTNGQHNTTILGIQIFQSGFGSAVNSTVQRQGYASALTVLQFILIGFFTLLAFLYLRRREVQL